MFQSDSMKPKNRLHGTFRYLILPTLLLTASVAASAATIVVNTLNGGSVPGQCTLLDAVFAASQNAPQQGCNAGDPGLDTIEFAPGLSGPIVLVSQLVIGEPLIINGNPGIEIDGNGNRIFLINPNAETQLRDLTLKGGRTNGVNEPGAAIYSQSDLLLQRVVIEDNRTLANDSPGGGVAVVDAELTLLSSQLIDNHTHGVNSPGGGVYVFDGELDMQDATIEGNRTQSTTLATFNGGGGIYLWDSGLSIHGSRIEGNQAAAGTSGLHQVGGRPDQVIRGSTIADNTGAGPCALVMRTALNVAPMDIEASTIKNNSGSVCVSRGTLRVVNSTITNNSASGFRVINSFGSPATNVQLRLLHSTVTDNLGGAGSANEIFTTNDVVISATNTIIANASAGGSSLCTGSLDSGTSTSNLATDASCGTGSLVGGAPVSYTDIMLDPPADNGGPTLTRAIAAGSLAVDAAHNPSCTVPAIGGLDQRGAPRPGLSSTQCDIGAFELQPQPGLSLSPTMIDFGNRCLGTFGLQETVTLVSTGATVLNVTDFQTPTTPFMSFTGTCTTPPFNLDPGDSCTRDYSFNPLGPGSFSQMLEVASDAPDSPHTLTLQGTAEHSVIFLPVTDFDFGQVAVGSLAWIGMQVQNQSPSCAFDIDLPNALGPLPPEFQILPGTCGPSFPVTILAGDSCTLDVEFSPSSVGPVTHANQLGHMASTGSGSYTLAGEGVPSGGVPDFDVAPSFWDFGTVALGNVVTGAIFVESVGSANLEIDDISIAPSGPFTISGGTCAVQTVLMPGEHCLLEFEFQPTSTGTFDGEILLEFNVGTHTVPLTGIGASAGQLTITPAAVDFGQWCLNDMAPPETVTLENTGGAALDVADFDSPSSPFGQLPSPDQCPTPPFSMAVGESCTHSYNFLPVSAGAFSHTMTVDSSDPASPHLIVLEAEAEDVSIQDVGDIDFGVVPVGSIGTAYMSLMNSGPGCDLEIITPNVFGALPSEFDISTGTCPSFPFILGPGDSCELEVTFAPLSLGPVSHANALGTDATAGSRDYTLVGEGGPDPLFHDRFQVP